MTNGSPYVKLLTEGAFPGRIDPWAEDGYYFQQIHSGMIAQIIEQIQIPLLDLGYVPIKEASLQILQGGKPDVSIMRVQRGVPPHVWDYQHAAAEIVAEPVERFEGDFPELEAIFIADFDSDELVTVIEVISPSNKKVSGDMSFYQLRRLQMLARRVNIVEIDATRSINRLVRNLTTEAYPYHIAIHIPDDSVYLMSSAFDQPLKRFALPLREQVIPVDAHAAYEYGYRRGSIAAQLGRSGGYREADLPFPSLIPAGQRETLLEQVAAWREQLAALRANSP